MTRLAGGWLGLLALSGLIGTTVATAGEGAAEAGVAGDLPYRREVRLPPAPSPGAWVVVSADSVLAQRCAPGYTDVRLVDDQDVVVPFLVLPPRRVDEVRTIVSRHALVWQNDPEAAWATVDLGPGDGGSRLLALPTVLRDARQVRLQSSATGEDWRGVSPQPARLPGHSLQAAEGLTTLPGTARWLRVRYAGTDLPVDADSLAVVALRTREVPSRSVAFQVEPPRFVGSRAVVLCTIGEPGVHVSGVSFATPLGPYATRVKIQVRGDDRGWRPVLLIPQPELSALSFPPQSARAIRLEVTGIDPPDTPLEIVDVRAQTTRFVFPYPAAGRYRLLYGDQWRPPRAGPRESEFQAASVLVDASLGLEQDNPDFAEPGPGLRWLQRRPGLVTAIMLALLLVVVWIAISPARRGTERPEDPGSDAP